MKILWERLFKFVQQYFREKKTAKITMALSIIMAFGISYLLILPAITLETDSQESVLQSVYNQPTTVEQPVQEEQAESQLVQVQSAGSLFAEHENITVQVNYEAHTFEQPVRLQVLPSEDSTKYSDRVSSILEENSQIVQQAHSYELSFLTESGEKIEPQKEVRVSFTFKNSIPVEKSSTKWKFYHFKNNDLDSVEDLTDKTEIKTDETGLTSIEFSSDSFFNYTLVETAEKPITLYARKEWNEFDSDDVIDIELQVQNEDGSWRIAEVENAVQSIEAPDEATSTQLVWENVANSSATYRIIERAATNSELVNKTGNGSKEDPFVLTREVTEATVSMDSFLRSASNVQIAEQSGSFTLKKVNEKGKALAGAVFTLSDSTGKVMQTITTTNDSKGTVFSNLTKGTYTLRETKAPEGYQLLNDYYEIRVNHYGIVEAKYIKSTNSTSEEKISESRGNTIIRQPKVENVVEVLKYELTSTRSDTKKDNEDAVWMTSGEFIKLAFELKVKPDTQPGDSFTIKLDSKLSPTGIRERTLPPIPLKVGDTVVATGRYDEATNSFIYTFNDYVRREQNIKLSASYATMGADLKNVPYSGKQSFTNVIDGQNQPSKTFYIDYGASREMPGGVAKGLKIRNQVASVNRLTGEVERIIYINNGNDLSRDYVSSSLWSRHQITLDNQGQTDITNLEIFKVPNALKHTYMPDSMHGGTDGLEKITSAQYNPNSSAIIIEKNEFYDDATGKYSNGFLIKITEKLRVPTAATNMTATWGFTRWSSNSVSVSASVVASQAESAGEAERKTPVITISNKKEVVPTKTSITVRKQWLNEDGSEIGEPTISSITYNLNQISTTEDGTKTTTVYQANQTLTAAEQWTKRYDNLPISGVNEAKQKVSYAYYVEEVPLPGYSVCYLNESNADTVNPAEAAIVKGILTIKNQKLNMTSITVNKQWFTADKQPTDRVNGEISYDLKQIVHFDDGRKIIKDYLSGETLNHTMNWSKTYHELPKKGKEEGETVTYSYFVQENPIIGYNTSYQSENNEVDVTTPENAAIVSGIITIRNVSTRKYVLPNTGGPGVIMYYLLGVIVLLVVAGGLFYKFNLYS